MWQFFASINAVPESVLNDLTNFMLDDNVSTLTEIRSLLEGSTLPVPLQPYKDQILQFVSDDYTPVTPGKCFSLKPRDTPLTRTPFRTVSSIWWGTALSRGWILHSDWRATGLVSGAPSPLPVGMVRRGAGRRRPSSSCGFDHPMAETGKWSGCRRQAVPWPRS